MPALLLLFSINSNAEKYCNAWGGDFLDVVFGEIMGIEPNCSKGDVLHLALDVDPNNDGVSSIGFVVALYCDFDKEIVINSDSKGYYLQCIISDDSPREERSSLQERMKRLNE